MSHRRVIDDQYRRVIDDYRRVAHDYRRVTDRRVTDDYRQRFFEYIYKTLFSERVWLSKCSYEKIVLLKEGKSKI